MVCLDEGHLDAPCVRYDGRHIEWKWMDPFGINRQEMDNELCRIVCQEMLLSRCDPRKQGEWFSSREQYIGPFFQLAERFV